MRYEVEQKFPVDDLSAIVARLAEMGARVSEYRTEVDEYFNHPQRDFAHTDEALRIRRVDNQARITYKGPKIDATTKTRRELELPLVADQGPAWVEMLTVLGFRSVAEVRKRRRKAFVDWQGRRVEVSLDEVDRVGTFVEIEVVTDEHDLEAAKACLASLAERLGLDHSERRSYLELLLS